MIKDSEASGTDYRPCNLTTLQRDCEPLFVIVGRGTEDAAFEVPYRGVTYAIPADPDRGGNSTYALGIVKQLIGLNNSSKSRGCYEPAMS